MKAADELLTTDLWKTVGKLAPLANSRQAAVAYVTSELVRFQDGDLLIVDASKRAITSGETAAQVLLAAHRRGVVVCSYPDLHAKVIVLDDVAVIVKGALPDNTLGFDGVNMRQAVEDVQSWLAAREVAA